MANISMRGQWKPEIISSMQIFRDASIMDNQLFTIFKNICSATFATDILRQCHFLINLVDSMMFLRGNTVLL